MIEVKIELKDEKDQKIFEDYSEGKFDTVQFMEQLIGLINTVTDERDDYIKATEEKEM